MKDHKINKKSNTDSKRDDFKTQWKRRQQWQEQTQKSVPDNETLLRWAEKAQETYAKPEVNVIPFPSHHRNRWIPYAAAACIAVGVAAVGLNHQNKTNGTLPEAQEVKVEGQTVRFLCNNGCSAQEVMLSANEVIK
jgi:hypothetical protein